MSVGREAVVPARQALTRAPQRDRIESGDHQLSIGDQDALDLAQDLVRVIVEFENMRHDHQIDTVGCKREFVEVATHVGPTRFTDGLAQRNTVVRQQIELRQAQLQGVVAEQVDDDRVDLVLLPSHDVASLRCVEPVIDLVI